MEVPAGAPGGRGRGRNKRDMSTAGNESGGAGRRRSFPPGAGWIPLSLALVGALIVSAFSIRPQFDDKIVGLRGGGSGGPAVSANGSPVPGSSADPNNPSSKTVLGAGPGGTGTTS